ncbi:MAG: NAD-dependent epimerase/dehydratase family protein [Lysobacterales bacterium]|jgi:nucleoside-diphosphate-sugar epimerase
MRVLIAGCGFVGIALARRLLRLGHDVHGLRRSAAALPAGVRSVQADITRPQTLRGLPDDIDCLLFMPSPERRDRAAYTSVFIDGWNNLWAAFKRPPGRSILVSSTAVYAQDDGSWIDEQSAAVPSAFNGEVLLDMERSAQGCSAGCVVVRCTGIYGPGRDRLIRQSRVPGLEVQASPPLYTNRIHRDDVAGALSHLALMPSPRSLYLASDDCPAPRYDVLAWLASRQGAAAPKRLAVEGGSRGKRVSNQGLRESGYELLYPDYRAGYSQLLSTE